MRTIYNHDHDGNYSDVVLDSVIQTTLVKFSDFLPSGLTPTWGIRLRGLLTVNITGRFELGLCVAGEYSGSSSAVNNCVIKGRAKLWTNGTIAIDNWTKQRNGQFLYVFETFLDAFMVIKNASTASELLRSEL